MHAVRNHHMLPNGHFRFYTPICAICVFCREASEDLFDTNYLDHRVATLALVHSRRNQ